jgi:small conductance mechanosensitive channel
MHPRYSNGAYERSTLASLRECFILLIHASIIGVGYLLVDLLDLQLIVQVFVIIVASFILVMIFNRLIRVAEERVKVKKGRLVQIQRFFQLIVYSVAVILILWSFNVDVTGLLAGLGIGALVIGFALKDIIENWISGLLIILGKTYRIGDVIRIENFTGVVTDVSLRTTKLRTYDRNEIIIPNSTLLKQNIINLTGGKKETVASVISYIDYVFDVEKAKKAIESVLRGHPNIVVDEKRKREIRFVVRSKEWTTEIESLFWINEPENEEFIKSRITELIKSKFEKEEILPPLPGIMRRDFLNSKNFFARGSTD